MTEEFDDEGELVLERLMAAYDARTADELGHKMGVPSATVRTWQKRGGVPAKYCQRAALETGVLLDWLMLGRMEDGSKRPVHFDYLSSLVNQAQNGKPYDLPHSNTVLFARDSAWQNDDLVEVAKYDCSGSCGPGNLLESARVIDHIPVSRQWLRREGLQPESTIVIGSKGDSMAPKIPPGSQLMVNLAKRDPSLGGVFAFVYENELFIKYVQRTHEGLFVSSEQSERNPPRLFKWEEAEQIHIEGRIHLVISRV